MKYKTSLITILWGSLLCFTLPVVAQNSLQHQKDSLRQVIEHSEGIDKLKSYNAGNGVWKYHHISHKPEGV